MGGSGAGFNPAAMMTSIALGGVVGQNIAGTMQGAMSGMNNAGMVPPPVPSNFYHIAVNGQAMGPFDLNMLKSMVPTGQLIASTLVWKAGLPAWVRADSVEDLKSLFGNGMPPIPTL